MAVAVYPPGSPDASKLAFGLEQFMGKWYVTHSTLPLWKNKTDVTITYTPLSAQTEGPVQFLDRVEYSKAGSSKRSIIDGVDTQQDHPTHFRWRGKGILMIATSRWQLLGCGSGDDGEEPWALTFFEKTWFTPAGMDIYSRTPQGLSVPLVEEILAKVKGLQGDVAAIADGFFEVERNKS